MARRDISPNLNATSPKKPAAAVVVVARSKKRLAATAVVVASELGTGPTEITADGNDVVKRETVERSSENFNNSLVTMSLTTQEKRLDSSFVNNNDHNYLHKKFKKVASSAPAPAQEITQKSETLPIDKNATVAISVLSISNGSIAACHPEIEKHKGIHEYQNYNTVSLNREKSVQNATSDIRISTSNANVFDRAFGKTSSADELRIKTENHDNDLRDAPNGSSGRYICPYCKLSCAKPSVLQKHIRAHTNERPYPCVICGFAFKTKSNLYKHCKSRTHALRLQGADVAASPSHEDELSADSESDASQGPPAAASDFSRPSEFSSPELLIDNTPHNSISCDSKFKTIYKPKFRAAFYKETDEKDRNKKTFSPNADFLNEHISKIISDNEAIVDVIDTPLQKKYNKIKQIAESQQFQFNEHNDFKSELAPLNLTKSVKDSESSFRKRAHSDTIASLVDSQKHPLNPEGSIIKDLLLKTKGNGLLPASPESEGNGPLFVCPLCQIPYRSADNLEIHRLYYCKGANSNNALLQKEAKKIEHIYMRSNSINVRLPETNQNNLAKQSVPLKSPSPRQYKPDNIIIVKQEPNDVIAPLPSPGPLLGNTRLVDTRAANEYAKSEKKYITSPKIRHEMRNDVFNSRLVENVSPRTIDSYLHAKIRCIDQNSLPIRNLDELQSKRNNSLQMFGGEVKIVDHAGSTTTLRIEPSKNQLSPIILQQNLSPSDLVNKSEASSIVVRSGLHSGGTLVQTPKDVIVTSKPQTTRITMASNLTNSNAQMQDITRFQFPPLSAITAFNPLTLPPLSPSSNGASSILHGGKLIPHVPGMPGPNTLNPKIEINNLTPEVKNEINASANKFSKKYDSFHRVRSPNNNPSKNECDRAPAVSVFQQREKKLLNNMIPVSKSKPDEEIFNLPVRTLTTPTNKPTVGVRLQSVPTKRTLDGLSKTSNLKEGSLQISMTKSKMNEKIYLASKPDLAQGHEIRNFNFENLITKAEIYNHQITSADIQKSTTSQDIALSESERSETSYFQKNCYVKSVSDERKAKFLRPSTLPLKPGTFTPKRHHGITPTANTMPLVSPETPRPAKAYGQLYLNGNAYTYLGLKCSTKVFYCTINRPQPTYVPNQHFLSMYSNWQLLSELTPDPFGLSTSSAMSLYDSRHRPQNTTVATIKQDLILTHSSQSTNQAQILQALEAKRADGNKLANDPSLGPKKELAGGFESNEEYTYIRGRGRGRYVCSECGIRCKKPSMLKKHIRTHTDVRPYTCIHCAFSFKTKGNLTKHMKSKAHYKKCCELGINPNEGTDMDGVDAAQCSGEDDDETDTDGEEGNEGETESSDTEVGKSRLPEHEAAHCLLSLGNTRPTTSATPGLITSARPSTYPYTPVAHDSAETDAYSTDSDSRHENEPMDLSKSDVKSSPPIPEITTPGEPSVLASLAFNTAKLPQSQAPWSNGEPMLHAYLTERALLDTKIKQSQLASSHIKVRKIEPEKPDTISLKTAKPMMVPITVAVEPVPTSSSMLPTNDDDSDSSSMPDLVIEDRKPVLLPKETVKTPEVKKGRAEGNTENAKFVVSEFLKMAQVECSEANTQDGTSDAVKKHFNTGDMSKDDPKQGDTDSSKHDHEPVARKVVIGAGGVAFKLKGKDSDNSSSYSPTSLMEDGSRVCDFCNKSFTKPSQLRLHLNIHYMERPFRCSACAVSFRTRGHLQKHERSGSHHNKVSMTSTFGAATSLNPRPFRCSDCNIAFRIHGHLAKHLRSKMHVMRLECLFKLPFGTFTEIERAGVSLTDIDTTDCASSLASLQSLAKKLHEKDPTKLEYLDPNTNVCKESSDDEDGDLSVDRTYGSDKDAGETRTNDNGESKETNVIFSATD